MLSLPRGMMWLFLAANFGRFAAAGLLCVSGGGSALRKAPTSRFRLQPPIAQMPPSYPQQPELPPGWAMGLDEVGGPYYYCARTGQSQWEPPSAAVAPQVFGADCLWRVEGGAGVTGFIDKGSHFVQDEFALPYLLRCGDEQVLSRFHMIEKKLTVSRVQAAVRVHHDGTATLTSCGRGPTLWRTISGPWVALQAGDWLTLTHGDQVSLDCNAPASAVFTCQDQMAQQLGGHRQHEESYGHGHTLQGQEQPQELPYPWEQLVDGSGAVYYSNPLTGESSWDAIGKGYTGG